MMNATNLQEWLSSLKVGDEVILNDQTSQSICTVHRATQAQVFILINGIKDYEQAFWKKNGYAVGSDSSWRRTTLSRPDPSIVQSIRDKSERRRLEKWARETAFSLRQLRAMKGAFDQCVVASE